MSSYNRVIIFLFTIFLIFGCSPSQSNYIDSSFKYKDFGSEDKLILFALDYENNGKKDEARKLFKKLYNQTSKEEYLLEFVKTSFILKKYDDLISFVDKNVEKVEKNEEKILRIYVLALIQKRDYNKALLTMHALLKKYDSDANNELLGNIYLQKKDYLKAKEVFEKVYKNSFAPSALLNLTDVMYAYLGEKKEAINYLESHIKFYGCNNIICSKLLSFYQEQKDVDGVISVLKKTYYNFKETNNNFNLEKVYKLLIYYLEKKDVNEAIAFLEKSGANDNRLLELYRNTGKLEKAYKLAQKQYETTGNIEYLAQIAILEFEKAKNKRKVLKSVIKKFKDVLTVLDNHVYQNYLGYILIDYDLNVKEGIDLVNKALKKAPNNFAYLDSLAWGQYKLGLCKEAYKNMKKVVDGVGLKDKEIKNHWKEIKECKK